ncbi:aquaporin [Candidatus Saccharibacteria bacterium]|nr:aquaporin [Candidatus Saccharibacteria bacterium]
MATKKSKSSSKSQKDGSSKAKTSPKTKATSEVTELKDNQEDKKKSTTVSETITETTVEDTVTEETKSTEKTHTVSSTSVKKPLFRGFFSRKYTDDESIVTIFKKPKFYGALIGEVIGTMLLTLLIFSMFLMGLPSIATYAIGLIALVIGVYAFSGACLNPIVTAGMMATRRISVIRGIMYIIAEIVGAWLGWLIFNAFHSVGGESAYDVPAIAALADGAFWKMAFIEIFGGIVIGFSFARAQKYKRSALTFGAITAGSIVLAFIVGYVISAAFLGASNNFVMNPAIAMMLQVFPTSGADFGEIFGGIMQALSLYALLPMCAGIVGFYLSDFTARLVNED